MSAFPRNLLLLDMGADVLMKYGTFSRRLGSPTRGGEGLKETWRNNSAYALCRNGLYQQAVNFPRVEWLVDPVSGQPQAYLKMEAGGTNYLLHSQDWATSSPWSLSNVTGTNNNAVAPDNSMTATTLITSNAGPQTYYKDVQNVTITAGENVAISTRLKAIGYKGLLFRCSDTGGSNGFQFTVDLSTGLTGTTHAGFGTGTLVGYYVIPLGNGYYELGAWGTLGGSITTAQYFTSIWPTLANADAQSSYTGDNASGFAAWGGQLERNGSNVLPPTSYIATLGSALNRTNDSFTIPANVAPAPGLWLYGRTIERGTVAYSSTAGLFCIGSAIGQRLGIFQEAGSGVYKGIGGVNDVRIVTGVAPTYGQAVEHLIWVDGSGNLNLRQSINNGTENVPTPVASGGVPSSWSAPTLQPGQIATLFGWTLISRIMVGLGAGSLVNTIADVRAIPI